MIYDFCGICYTFGLIKPVYCQYASIQDDAGHDECITRLILGQFDVHIVYPNNAIFYCYILSDDAIGTNNWVFYKTVLTDLRVVINHGRVRYTTGEVPPDIDCNIFI